MNLQQLEYFKNIAATKNFTTAAKLSSVSQPALSKATRKLEEELKVPLFERNSKTIELTPFGNAFLKHAVNALKEIDNGIEELQHMLEPETSVISIAATFCIGRYFMPFLISDFLNTCADAKFQFNQETTPSILKDLRTGKINFGFYDTSNKLNCLDDIDSILIKKEEYIVLVSKNHPLSKREEVSLTELKDEAFIVFGEESKSSLDCISKFIAYKPKIFMEPSSYDMLGGLITAGAGIAIATNNPLINTSSLTALKIKENIGYKSIYMGWLKNSYMSPIAEKFKEHIAKALF